MAQPYTVSDRIPGSLQARPSEFLGSKPHLHRLMAAAMVFRTSPHGHAAQTLLLRRAPRDSSPPKWEVPGGSTDEQDATVLDSVRRELHEKTGLHAKTMLYPVGMLDAAAQNFEAESDARNEGDDAQTVAFWERERDEKPGNLLRWGKVTVVVDVHEEEALDDDGSVRLVDTEHDRCAWATREEIYASKFADGEDIGFVSGAAWRIILEGFRLHGEKVERAREREREAKGARMMAKFGGIADKGPW
ncbi:hypothetical protein ED733_001198 [Metarhizium rileyi]|uniref:Nudix hydrolase domain-containing protein n=1 Tax=Metarhizium rileyi (strain RCEF 4871) TaxID=1649241 RepID=A0A5C6G3L8_METRR|nr:hypothetical protein ED733_001198 [Metarhizium rileyi]